MPYFLVLKSYLTSVGFLLDSELKLIQSGVPQGSVLAPVLETLFTTDLLVLGKDSSLFDTAFRSSDSNANGSNYYP